MKKYIVSLTFLSFLFASQFSAAGACRPSCEGIKGACSCVVMDTGEKCCGSASDKITSGSKTETKPVQRSITNNY